jgi:aminoglycoside phosphotransferase (APT) family kinase protein
MPSPPAPSLAWAASSLGPHARIVATRRLTGGITSHVDLLTIDTGNGKSRERCVLRRMEPGEYFDLPWAVDAVAREAAALTALAASDIPAPRLIASTTDPAHGGPSVLMTRVPGRIHLMPRDREAWLRQMAVLLSRIHALPISARPFESWLDRDRQVGPADTTRPEIWRAALELATFDPTPAVSTFIHRDYQHFNLLWTRDRLTGVVDWVGAATGPPDIDVGHCRLNLAVLFSAELADRFLEMYEAESGRRVDPRWDVHSLLSFGADWGRFLPLQVGERAPIDAAGMMGRVEALLERALRRA